MVPGRICNILVAETSVSISEARLRRSRTLNMLSLQQECHFDHFVGVLFLERLGKAGRS